jgi:small GTP-binding protein
MSVDYKWKVVMLGDFAVGKTSLVRRYVYDEFSDSYLTTIGVKVTRKDVAINDSLKADLLLWDIAGSDKFIKISPDYLKGASAGIIVADLTRKSTIENIPEHIDLLRSVNPSAMIFIALNKSDMSSNTEEQLKNTKNWISGNQFESIFITSAKDGSNIESLFKNLTSSVYQGIRR